MNIDRDRLRTGGALSGALFRGALPSAGLPRELEPGDVIGPFRIVRELSRGGMAIVYLAERADGEFSQRVALKWMGASADRATAEILFRRERQTLAGLEHPGIARLIDGGRTSDAMLWFAMELVDGEPIDAWCRSRNASLATRLRLTIALCEALAFAHAQLLVHRDIKPANVLVDKQGRTKLLDFGIARLADQTDLLGNFALTPRYASPEQWRGESVTVSSDIYQTGLLLATLLDVLPAQELRKAGRAAIPNVGLETSAAGSTVRGEASTSAGQGTPRVSNHERRGAVHFSIPQDERLKGRSELQNAQDLESKNSQQATTQGSSAADADSAPHVTALHHGAGAEPGPAPLSDAQLAHLPRDLAAILRRATALLPSARYASMAAFAQDLSNFLSRRPVAARDGGVAYRVLCLLQRQPIAVAGVVLALVLLATFGWRIAVESAVARQQASRATAQAARAESVLDFLYGLLAWATPQKHRGEEKTVAEALAYGVDQLRDRVKDQPGTRAQLLYMLGQVYSQRRERERSRALYAEAYDLLHNDPAGDTALLAETAYGLAAQLSDARDRGRSLALIDEAMTLYAGHREKAERRIHAWRLKAIRLNQNGQLDRAIAENRAAVASATQNLGRENVATARAIHDLSGRLAEAGQNDEALALKREGYEILKRLEGADHPDTSLAALGLAGLLIDRGNYAEADTLVASDGEVRLRLWGDKHPEYARHLYLLASYRLQRGNPEQALELIRQAIAINEANGAIGRTALALQYELLGRVEESLEDFAASLAAYRHGQQPELFGAKLGWDGGDLSLGAARALRKLGRFDEASIELKRAAELWHELPAQHPSRGALAIEHGFAALASGGVSAAREQATRARTLLPAWPAYDASRKELALLDERVEQHGGTP